MLTPLIEIRADLITKIKAASSQNEVKEMIDKAMESLEQNQITANMVSGFIEKMLSELESFSPMNKDAQQWSNIKMAMIWFQQKKRDCELSAY